MEPVTGGPVKIICGWNSTTRAELLRLFETRLPGELLVGAFLVRKLKAQGRSFWLENHARMRHFDPPGLAREFSLLVIVGYGFGALRTKWWKLPARLLYTLAGPAIALLHWKRAFLNITGEQVRIVGFGVAASLQPCCWRPPGVGRGRRSVAWDRSCYIAFVAH
jgi:hypothetical protein